MAESNAVRDANAFARTSAGAGPCAPKTPDKETTELATDNVPAPRRHALQTALSSRRSALRQASWALLSHPLPSGGPMSRSPLCTTYSEVAVWLSVALSVAAAACGGGVSSTGSSPDAGHAQASATSGSGGTGPSAPDGGSSGGTDAAFSADCPASGTIDATTTAWDGGRCIYIDVTTYDVSCHADSDCTAITGSCPSAGNARCVQGPCGGVCTWCPRKIPNPVSGSVTLFGQPIPPGCPDAG